MYCHTCECQCVELSHARLTVYVSTIYLCVILLLLGSATNYVYP